MNPIDLPFAEPLQRHPVWPVETVQEGDVFELRYRTRIPLWNLILMAVLLTVMAGILPAIIFVFDEVREFFSQPVILVGAISAGVLAAIGILGAFIAHFVVAAKVRAAEPFLSIDFLHRSIRLPDSRTVSFDDVCHFEVVECRERSTDWHRERWLISQAVIAVRVDGAPDTVRVPVLTYFHKAQKLRRLVVQIAGLVEKPVIEVRPQGEHRPTTQEASRLRVPIGMFFQ